VLSAKEMLEGELSAQMEIRDRHRDNIIRYYTQSNEVSSNDSLLAFLDRDLNLNSKYLKALAQFKNKDWAAMNSTLTGIPLTYLLTESESVNHTAFSYLLNLNRRLLQSGKSLLQIDSLQADSLNNLYGITSGFANARIRNYLIHSDSHAYYEPVLLPGTGFKKGQIRFYNNNNTDKANPSLSVYPNPAKNYVVIKYKISDANGLLTISNNEGKQLFEIVLSEHLGYNVISLDKFPSGLLLFQLSVNKTHIKTCQVVKTK
jgi:hypothetical protein